MSSDKRCVNMVVEELVYSFGIDHPAVTTCHNVFFSNNSFHLVMELMDGGSLLEAVKRCKVVDGGAHIMPPAALACIAENVLSALEFLHDEMHVMHRDVKPGNILLSTTGQAKLGDLGIACSPSRNDKHTAEWVGTVSYMSPERLRGDSYSFSADMWSLGLVLVEAAIGHYPLVEPVLQPDVTCQKLNFWDLLELSQGPCPAAVLSGHGNSQWESLQVLSSACLAQNPSHRPRAALLLSPPSSKIEYTIGTGGSYCGGVSAFLASADTCALVRWVQHSLKEAPAGCETGVVDEAGLEADGWV